MKRVRKSFVLLTLALVVVAGSQAVAGPTDPVPELTGGPSTGGSWFVGASASGVGPYDLIAVQLVSGSDVFESPAIRNLSNAGWSMLLDQPTLASFSGPTVSSLTWDLYFAGAAPTAVELNWAIFNGSQLTAWTHWNLDANGGLTWQRDPADGWQPDIGDVTPPVVPAPAALLLGAFGTGLVGYLRKRRAL